MKVAEIQFAGWDKIYDFSADNLSLEIGDRAIVETDSGLEIGKVVGLKEVEGAIAVAGPDGEEPREIKPILRKANEDDLSKLPSAKEKAETMDVCRKMIEKRDLPMKLVDVAFSLSGSRLNFAFIADGRIDFRELVKDLTGHFNKLIRLTQIGIRDEARLSGDFGHCGRQLCCRSFLRDFSSITSEMAEAQQVVHRGSDRISGCCGRLMCCLGYEFNGYKDLAAKMPSVGDRVSVDGKRGIAVGIHILKQTVDVEFQDEKEGRVVVEVDLNRQKKEQGK